MRISETKQIFLILGGAFFTEGDYYAFYFTTRKDAEDYLRNVLKMKYTKQDVGGYLFERVNEKTRKGEWAMIVELHEYYGRI
jgi:hypothetical protein